MKTPFPHTEAAITGIKSKGRNDNIEVHYHCRMLELKDIPMIACIKWFHVDCEAVPKKILDDSQADWFCCYCK